MAIEGLISKMDAESARQVAGCRFNSPGALLNFLRFLIVRLRVLGYAGVFFTVEGALTPRVFSTGFAAYRNRIGPGNNHNSKKMDCGGAFIVFRKKSKPSRH